MCKILIKLYVYRGKIIDHLMKILFSIFVFFGLSSCNDFSGIDPVAGTVVNPPVNSNVRKSIGYSGEKVILPSGHKVKISYGQIPNQQTLSNGWKVGAIVTY